MLDNEQRREVDQAAELVVRRYFDHYLEHILPQQMESHNRDLTAHNGIRQRVERQRLWIILIAVAAFGGTAGGGLVARFLPQLW